MKDDFIAFLILLPVLLIGWVVIQAIAAFISMRTKHQHNLLFIVSVFCWIWAVICIVFIKFYIMG